MITEQEILDLGFTKEDYSTSGKNYYTIDISRAKRYQQYDAHNKYTLEVIDGDSNPHKLGSTLRLGVHYSLNTNSWHGTFKNIEHLNDVLESMIKWDLKH